MNTDYDWSRSRKGNGTITVYCNSPVDELYYWYYDIL